VQLDASNYDALYDLGVQLLQTGHRAEGRPYLEQFVRTAPKGLHAEDIKQLTRVLNESQGR
jgi:hypothetical protein